MEQTLRRDIKQMVNLGGDSRKHGRGGSKAWEES